MMQRKVGKLNKLNRNETLLLRITRKLLILAVYPNVRKDISDYLKTAPEIIRFVQKPTTLDATYNVELVVHRRQFMELLTNSEEQLDKQYEELSPAEEKIDGLFMEAYKKLSSDNEKQIGGFEWYGYKGRHFAFKNIMMNMGIIPRNTLSVTSKDHDAKAT